MLALYQCRLRLSHMLKCKLSVLQHCSSTERVCTRALLRQGLKYTLERMCSYSEKQLCWLDPSAQPS